MTRIGICGAGGRMGRMLIQAVDHHRDAKLAAAIERTGSSLLGVDAGELVNLTRIGVALTDDLSQVMDQLDVLIDFSHPQATVDNAKLCLAYGVNMVIGTTGLDDTQNAMLQEASERIAMVYAGNYSTGVNLTLKLLKMAAQAFGTDADVEIVEAHHKHKIDAPSGTAFMMAQAVAEARGQNLNDVAVYGRSGQTGERPVGSIGIHAVRGGEIIGDHSVMFIADGEMVEIRHHARDRMTFAAGAVRAAVWVAAQQRGMYDMQDVLGIKG